MYFSVEVVRMVAVIKAFGARIFGFVDWRNCWDGL